MSPSIASAARARSTAGRSWSPIGASTTTQVSPGAVRSRSRTRPRSHRVVDRNGTEGRPRGAVARRGSVMPSRANRHQRAAGQSAQSALRGAAQSGPEVHHGVGPGTWLVRRDRGVGEVLHRAGREDLRVTGDDAAEHAPDIRVHSADRDAVRDRRDGTRRVRPDARQRLEYRDIRGHATAVLRDDLTCRQPQVPAAAVVAETLPLPQHVGERRGRERLDRRESRHEPFPPLRCAGRLRLLRHRLRDEDRVRIGRPAERQGSTARGVPVEDRVTRRGREG